ncbi:MAG: hypothetical protein C0630_17035 [Sedimenticola selenatireducens]|uniref:Uncharacterized protein n=1 Tax=Sedimenticola selenatireducens TaxID=191960 RepID=A0A2N6CSZ6_9GAMM|nr:MAG: hypothetical protein C0630_17035 [Sedimenticola selenatireducens]
MNPNTLMYTPEILLGFAGSSQPTGCGTGKKQVTAKYAKHAKENRFLYLIFALFAFLAVVMQSMEFTVCFQGVVEEWVWPWVCPRGS